MRLVTVLAWLMTPLLPLWMLLLAAGRRTRRDIKERLGLSIAPVAVGAVWIHASSVGEMMGAINLARVMTGSVLITADTDTGVRVGRRFSQTTGGRVVVMVRPIDHPLTLSPLLAECLPRQLILVESVWLPVLADMVTSMGVPIVRVSAKAGRSTRRLGRLGLYAFLTHQVTAVFARSSDDAAWFCAHSRSVVYPSVDLKLAQLGSDNPLVLGRDYVVAASTRGEEEALIKAAKSWRDEGPDWVLIIAPRHPERFDEVATILDTQSTRWVRRTDCVDGVVPVEANIVLLDSIGDLAAVVASARAVYVGGTFDVRIGGHSPAEAFAAGVGVLAGPEVSSNRAIFEGHTYVSIASLDDVAMGFVRASALTGASHTVDLGPLVANIGALVLGSLPKSISPRPWAIPFVPVWLAVSLVRNFVYDKGLISTIRLSVPVISVGSPNARGAGKTPAAIMVASYLRDQGHRVGVAVRGYRRDDKTASVHLSTDTRLAAHLGDEGALIAKRGFIVAASPRRVEAAQALVDAGVTVVVFEDGLGHRRLHRDLDITIVDARNVSARGLMPAGERREWAPIPKRAHRVLCQYARQGTLPKGALPVTRTVGMWHHGDEAIVLGPSGPVRVLLSVGRPGDIVAQLGLDVSAVRIMRDHAPIDDALTHELLDWAQGEPIVVTAKDRVRLPATLFDRVWWRDIDMTVTAWPTDWFDSIPMP